MAAPAQRYQPVTFSLYSDKEPLKSQIHLTGSDSYVLLNGRSVRAYSTTSLNLANRLNTLPAVLKGAAQAACEKLLGQATPSPLVDDEPALLSLEAPAAPTVSMERVPFTPAARNPVNTLVLSFFKL